MTTQSFEAFNHSIRMIIKELKCCGNCGQRGGPLTPIQAVAQIFLISIFLAVVFHLLRISRVTTGNFLVKVVISFLTHHDYPRPRLKLGSELS